MGVLSLVLMMEAGLVTLLMQLAARDRRRQNAFLLLGFVVVAMTVGFGALYAFGELVAVIAMTTVLSLTLMAATVLGARH